MFRSSRPSKNPTVSKDRAQVFQLNLGASFPPEPEDESLGVADKVVAINGLNPNRWQLYRP